MSIHNNYYSLRIQLHITFIITFIYYSIRIATHYTNENALYYYILEYFYNRLASLYSNILLYFDRISHLYYNANTKHLLFFQNTRIYLLLL